MCFFQEKFQESLKKLRQEQQEAEKLAAVIREKRISWKVRDSSEGVLEQKSSQGMGAEGKGDPALEATQWAPRDLRHDLRGEWHPLLALETRPGSPGESGTHPEIPVFP